MLSAGKNIWKKHHLYRLHQAVFVRYVLLGSFHILAMLQSVPSHVISWVHGILTGVVNPAQATGLNNDFHAAIREVLTATCVCDCPFISRLESLPPMTSKWEWSLKLTTHAIPPRSASPRWWVWLGSVCACVWTEVTTATTSGGWWTPLTSSPSAPARRTGTCCSRHWVRNGGGGMWACWWCHL